MGFTVWLGGINFAPGCEHLIYTLLGLTAGTCILMWLGEQITG